MRISWDLGIHDDHRLSKDYLATLAQLNLALQQKRILVVVDALDTALHASAAPLESLEGTQLLDVLLELRRRGTGVLLTSRGMPFFGERQAPQHKVADLLLHGLHPEDTYAFASHILDDLEIDRQLVSYAELRDLLALLDHHPLFIQFVLEAIKGPELSLLKRKSDFASLLQGIADNALTGRNKSLQDLLDSSLRQLGETQHVLLQRLSPFEGGANELTLLTITQISPDEWAPLRSALLRTALMVEEVSGVANSLFLHFHPMLIPHLRVRLNADDPALYKRYTDDYSMLAEYLSNEDHHHPTPVRLLARKELRNLRRTLELLLEEGDWERALEMADDIGKFLNAFGMRREHSEMWRQVVDALDTRETRIDDTLTRADWLRERALGEDELDKGNTRAAFTRFTNLLTRIESLPEATPRGRGSYEHCRLLGLLARCLRESHQPAAAERRVREALALLEQFPDRQSDQRSLIELRGFLLYELGHVLFEQGRYKQSRSTYEESLKIAEQLADRNFQSAVLLQIGTRAVQQGDYDEARARHAAALVHYRALNEPTMVAHMLYHLGVIAKEQKDWTAAEDYYRESLATYEWLGDSEGTAKNCSELAYLSEKDGRLDEAEGWYQRALELEEHIHPNSPLHSMLLHNFAYLLIHAVEAGQAPLPHLIEARNYASQSLAINETLDTSATWSDLKALATINDLEGKKELAREYRRLTHETFAAFLGNRHHIDKRFHQLITAIVDAARGDAQEKMKVEAVLPELEIQKWHISSAVQRIWAGERDWHVLTEDLSVDEALLLKLVLEELEKPEPKPNTELRRVLLSLPDTLFQTLLNDGMVALEQAFAALSPEAQRASAEAIRYLRSNQQVEIAETVRRFEPLLQAIAYIAIGEAIPLENVEKALADQEREGFHLREAVHRIWQGGRNAAASTIGLDKQDTELVHRILEIISEGNTSNTVENLNNQAAWYRRRREYEQAESLYRQALKAHEQEQGPDHLDTAKSLDNLADLYLEQGQYEQAEFLYRQALTIREQVLGADNPEVADSLNNLAYLYSRKGNIARAEPLFQRALAICEQARGPDNPFTAYALNNLAAVYQQQRKYEQAQLLYQRALAILERAAGSDHPDTAQSLKNLASVYREQHENERAELLYLRALETYKRIRGTDHPDLAPFLTDLADLYLDQGQYKQAEPLYQRALTIREQSFGLDHSSTLSCCDRLAGLYLQQKKYEQAEQLYQRSLTIRERILGTDHPDTARSLNNLGAVYHNQHKDEQAEPLFLRALESVKQAQSSEHPDVVQYLSNLTSVYHNQGKYEQAEPLFQQALTIRELTLGANHPGIIPNLNNLAAAYYNQGKYEQAEPLYQRSLTISEQAWGRDHPNTVENLINLADLYYSQNKLDQAEQLYQRALGIYERVLSPESQIPAAFVKNYANLLRKAKREDEARELETRMRLMNGKQSQEYIYKAIEHFQY